MGKIIQEVYPIGKLPMAFPEVFPLHGHTRTCRHKNTHKHRHTDTGICMHTDIPKTYKRINMDTQRHTHTHKHTHILHLPSFSWLDVFTPCLLTRSKNNISEFLLWCNGIGGVSAAPRCRFHPQLSAVG